MVPCNILLNIISLLNRTYSKLWIQGIFTAQQLSSQLPPAYTYICIYVVKIDSLPSDYGHALYFVIAYLKLSYFDYNFYIKIIEGL